MGFFSSGEKIRPGTKVTVYTVENWKGDGTGGAPGEVMEVTSLGVEIMWERPDGTITVDEFYYRSRRSMGPVLQAWFQLRSEPFSPEPEIPMVGSWSDAR